MNIYSLNSKTYGMVIIYETRVVLIGNRYTPEPAEPVHDSEYACTGTIVNMHKENSDYDVHVRWDNGQDNSYLIKDLRMIRDVEINNPNFAYRMWRRQNERR